MLDNIIQGYLSFVSLNTSAILMILSFCLRTETGVLFFANLGKRILHIIIFYCHYHIICGDSVSSFAAKDFIPGPSYVMCVVSS